MYGDLMKDEFNNFFKKFKSGTKLMFKEFFNKNTNKKQRANMWTFSRLIISFLIPIFSILSILCANIPLFIGSITFTGFGALTDFLDGRSAKKHNSFSEYGKLLDQIADKVFSIMLSITLYLFNPTFLLTLAGEGIIVSTNAFYKSKYKNLDIKSTQIGRIKQWPLFCSLVLGFISVICPSMTAITNISLIITFLLQIVTALSYIKSNNENIKKIEIKNINIKLTEFEENKEKSKEKIKTIEPISSSICNNKEYLKEKEELEKLKEELIFKEEKNVQKGFQKRKK